MDLIIKIAIITISDRASQGVYQDLSGPKAKECLQPIFHKHLATLDLHIIPDEVSVLKQQLQECINNNYDYIFTTGGTGIGPRDVTPEATRQIIQKEVPGIAEAIRTFSLTKTKSAMLSRGLAGITDQTIIINLPGNPKAVEEIITFLGSTLVHALYMLKGIDTH